MDVHIGELNSTVRVTDAQTLLSPQVLAEITRLVAAKVREEHEHSKRVEAERKVRPGVAAEETTTWG
jgi:hypothetical protein